MTAHYDRRAIGARASAIYREAKAAGELLTWPAAQKQAWAEAKSPRAVERCGTKAVAHIDAQQPGGVAAAMARYGISIKPAIERVAQFGQHLTEVLHSAAMRRQANVAALEDGGRVIDAARVGNEWRA